MKSLDIRGGINLRAPGHSEELKAKKQCVRMQNFRYSDELISTIPGTRKYHGTSLGSGPVTAIMPYYNDQTDQFVLLAACGGSIFKRDPATNEFSTLKSGLTPESIFSATIRHGVMYIASKSDGLKKYLGGNQIESVGGGTTAPGSFKIAIYMKEIDRIFGISSDAIFGQISWCDLSQPEVWDGANVERFKLKDGEIVEGAGILYGKLIVFCTYSIWIMYVSGNEENWKLEEAPTSIGCVAHKTIKKDGNRILYLGEAPGHALGVYAFNGSTSELLTDDITPLLKNANKNKLQDACAEIHDDLYTLSFAYGASETNNLSIDLDLVNRKEDGAPAIYGPHTFFFYSSSVLNNRQNNKEFLMGGVDDGYIYFENGNTFKSINGNDGGIIPVEFLSRIHNDDLLDTMKQYLEASVFFKPTTHLDAIIRYFISYGTFSEDTTWHPAVVSDSFFGEYDVHFQRNLAVPDLYEAKKYLEMNARGTSIQIGLAANTLGRLSFYGYGYRMKELYESQKIQAYN